MRFFVLACALCALSATPLSARAADMSVIRDSEIENALKEWSAPVMRAANLSPESVKLILIESNDINAFVAGGQNIFLYTGLIQKSDNAGEVLGVIAHELGHIHGGHLSRAQQAMKRASYEAMLGTMLGIGAAILTGEGGAAGALSSGASNMAARNFLQFSRIQESSADQAAMRFLRSAQLDPAGLETFMAKLEDQELIPPSQQSQYVRTHPLTRDRVDSIRAGIGSDPLRGRGLSPEWEDEFARVKAKLTGFITPMQVDWFYKRDDASIPAQYARAIAAYRMNQTDAAIAGMKKLIGLEPANPYFQEMIGQMLVDFGRVGEAAGFYRAAYKTRPKDGLIAIAYAQTLMDNPGSRAEAIRILEQARTAEPRSTKRLRLLATARGQGGDTAGANVELAEEAFLQRRFELAAQKAEQALASLKPGSRDYVRASDIKRDATEALSSD